MEFENKLQKTSNTLTKILLSEEQSYLIASIYALITKLLP
jgi:hypothetical protein